LQLPNASLEGPTYFRHFKYGKERRELRARRVLQSIRRGMLMTIRKVFGGELKNLEDEVESFKKEKQAERSNVTLFILLATNLVVSILFTQLCQSAVSDMKNLVYFEILKSNFIGLAFLQTCLKINEEASLKAWNNTDPCLGSTNKKLNG
jgi:hypothetical protein